MKNRGGAARKKGSLTVEAAIFLPVFLIAMLLMAYLIRMVAVEESVMHVLSDEGGRLAATAYLGQMEETAHLPLQELLESRLLGKTALTLKIRERVAEETRLAESLRTSRYNYLYTEAGLDELIRIEVSYRVRLPFILGRFDGFSFTDTLQTRGFLGAAARGEPLGYGPMEEEQEFQSTFVFPKYGERYHVESCSTIAVYPQEHFLNRSIRNRYTPCEICDPGHLPDGSRVYCFPQAGEVYHKGSCPTVEKSTAEIDREEALRTGYTPCKLCGGGE